jgi:lipoate-protein ligase A
MKLHMLPNRTGGAAENMALDFLLLQRYPEATVPRFRHYEWRRAACTFGFGQKIAFVRAHLPGPDDFDLCRRPTGGGIVDHRQDWTYSLVIPGGHALFDERATGSYRAVHECLAGALDACGLPAEVKTAGETMNSSGSELARDSEDLSRASLLPQAGPGICFQRAELYDVINPRTGAKIAGAAQKRNKHGLLLQGSVEKGSLGPVDWDALAGKFSEALGRKLGAGPEETPWPDLNEEEVNGLIEQYSAPEWLEYR